MDSTYEMVKELIDFNSEGVDTYNHNGSTWLIFTDNKKWVIELTKEKTLWYNYYFFTGVFKYLSLDVVENQHYITKWVEDTIINSVKSTKGEYYKEIQKVEYTINNGVKYTKDIEDTIQNGVKDTIVTYNNFNSQVENTIQTGVKCTIPQNNKSHEYVEHAIQNGVKSTCPADAQEKLVEDTIQNGVKKTKRSYEGSRKQRTKDTIQNGVKHTSNRRLVVSKDIEDTIQNGVKRTLQKNINRIGQVEDAIKNGVKKTYSDKIPHEYDWTEQFTEEIEGIIQNGVKYTEKSLQIDGSCVIEDVIKEGVKHTEYGDWLDGDERLDDIIDNGVKETTPGGYLGSVEMKGKTVHQFEHSKQDDDVKDVIKNGIKHTEISWSNFDRVDDVLEKSIKKTEAAALFDEESKMDTVISNGIKETHDDAYHHTGRVGGVIKNGVKQCIPSHTPLYSPMDFSVEYRENHRLDDVASVLEKGIKKTKAMDEWVNTDRIVDGVISGGVKKSPI
jgi:hypothetical protein